MANGLLGDCSHTTYNFQFIKSNLITKSTTEGGWRDWSRIEMPVGPLLAAYVLERTTDVVEDQRDCYLRTRRKKKNRTTDEGRTQYSSV